MKRKNWINLIVVLGLLASSSTAMPHIQPVAWSAPAVSNPRSPTDAVHYVKPGAGGACSSWTDACEMQIALGSAALGDEIWVAEGTYTPGADREDTFQLVDGVAIYGGFAATETLRSQRDWTAHPTVLSGEIGSAEVITDNVEHIVTGSGVTETAVLDGFIITGAYAVYACSPDFDPLCYPRYKGGGGMRIYGGDPTLANLTFIDNAASWGGGMYNGGDGDPTLTHVTFSSNQAEKATEVGGDGGGMFNKDSNPTLTHVTFNGNTATSRGGGMYNHNADTALTNVMFRDNSTDGSGGGLYNFYANPTLTHVTFAGNSATNSGGGMHNYSYTNQWIYPTLTHVIFSDNSASEGGGMCNDASGIPTLTDVLFSGNTATDGGGMMNNSQSSPILTNTIFAGNSASGKGGGMFNEYDCNAILRNVVFSGNAAASGGGMNNYESDPTLINVTFSHNSATNAGGAVFNGPPQAIATLTNCVLWGNTATSGGAQIHNEWPAGGAVVTYSDVQGGWGGTGNIDVDPYFVDPGGPDGVFGTLDDNLRLTLTPVSLADSPIDTGNNAAVPAGVTTDLDGNARIWPTNVDMGAYEAPYTERGISPPPHILHVTPNGVGNCTDWALSCALQHALNWARALNGEIWVAGGVYTPTFRTDAGDPRSATFPLPGGVPLYSGFAGVETTRDQRDPGANVTVLSGDLDGDDLTGPHSVVLNAADIRGSNAYHVVTSHALSETDILEAFVITGGQADGATPHDSGGGLYNDGGSPTLVNLLFSGNAAAQTGGGLYNNSGGPLLANVTFHGNSAGASGGALGNGGSGGLTLANSILWNNAPAQQPISSTATLTLTHSLVTGGCLPGANCDAILDADPLFVDAANGDLGLQCASPAIDAGDNSAVPAGVTTDLAGKRRISGIYGSPQVDMGAYEEQYYGDQVTLGQYKLQEGSLYRTGFHEVTTKTISATIALYDDAPFIAADQAYANALGCADAPGRRDHAVSGRLDARWEWATGELLVGNDDMVRALDMRLLPECPGGQPSLSCQIERLEAARDHFMAATGAYHEILAGDLYTATLAAQPTRVSRLTGENAPYADVVRLAEASAKKSRAYLELAERRFRQFTGGSIEQAEATLREGFDGATAELALLDRLTQDWSGASEHAAYQTAYQALTQNIADMQRMFTYLAHDKNPLGYEADYVPFYLHFDTHGVPLEESNFVAAWDIAQTAYTQSEQKLTLLLATQRELDDDEMELGAALNELNAKYVDELGLLCGYDEADPDLAYCHQNQAGAMYDQLLAVQSAHLRVNKVYQEMDTQLALIRIEQERAAHVAGLQRATAVMYKQTGQELADLARQEAQLRFSKSAWGNFSSIFGSVLSGGMTGGELGQSFNPAGAVTGGGVNLILGIGDMIDEANTAGKLADIAAKREKIQAYQQAYVKYKEAEITDANSEALIKTYMLKFAELDLDLALAVNELEREIAQLKGLKERVEYLLAGWAEARRDAYQLYRDPAARVLRDWQAEDTRNYFEVALASAYEAARALDYEIAEKWSREDEVYGIVDIALLDNYLFDMNQAYDNWIEGKSFAPEATVLHLSEAMGFADGVDIINGQPVTVTAQEKFNDYVSDPENWVDLDNDDQAESLQLAFQTSIFKGNPPFDAGVHNDKIHKFSVVLEGDQANLDSAGDGTRVRLTQSGTSFIRHEDAWLGGQDSFRAYNLAPHTANVDALINVEPGGSPWEGTEWSPGHWWRSVGCSKWILTIDREYASKNFDLDLAALEEIELHILHRNFALPVSAATDAPSSDASVDVSDLASNADTSCRYGGTVVPEQPERLPQLELTLVISETDGYVSGFLDAPAALGYPVLDAETGRGPAITGTVEGGKLFLTSEVFTGTGGASRHQMELHTNTFSSTEQLLTGVYTERVWNLAPHALIMVGEFTLMRYGSQETRIYLPIISRQSAPGN